jgi:hypothetical protein
MDKTMPPGRQGLALILGILRCTRLYFIAEDVKHKGPTNHITEVNENNTTLISV